MRIIGFKAYRRGYTGFVEKDDNYLFFTVSGGRFKAVQAYPKKDFESYHHFITLIGKFMRSSFFLKNPVEVSSVDQQTLDGIHENLNRCR